MTLIFGILLAFACALATNIGFIYKHRGACAAPSVDVTRPFWTTRKLYASRWFAVGMVVAAVAWVFHVAAMAVAPLSVVQPVLAGGVVLLAVMAEKMLGVRVGTRQWIGLGLTALGLVLLALTLPATHGAQSHFSLPGMIGFESALIVGGGLLIMGPRIGAPAHHHGFMLGAAAGMMFGVSDVAIKAISGLVGSSGLAGLLTPWSAVTAGASVVAFFASAKGLQDGEPVAVIAVTGTAASVAGIVGGIIVFGDPMPANPVVLIVQCLAFTFVVLAAWLMPAPVRAAPAFA
ncbi:MAG TPA: DMT family transporter [Solirubrobacteraceae bacterium]|nr:DMT family transporter [Solirubrobacteraceae bacterium]